MSALPRDRFPSATFVGALLGIGYWLVVPPRMKKTSEGTIATLLAWSLAGLVSGAVVDALAACIRR